VDGGLIVPVIPNADQLTLKGISESVKDLASRARNNQLSADEYQGSTFTVSNLGMYGIDSFTPIINQPNAAILGVCAAQPELAMDDEGKVYQKQVMKLCVTFDHRLLDGAEVGKFQMTLRDLLEKPLNILL
jgi:pyruvate dehydrogenase E2 component (dihydrolipoamide acetyltransferase)